MRSAALCRAPTGCVCIFLSCCLVVEAGAGSTGGCSRDNEAFDDDLGWVGGWSLVSRSC